MIQRNLIAAAVAFALSVGAPVPAHAGDPIGDFFKRIGNSLARPHQSPAPRKPIKKAVAKSDLAKEAAATPPPSTPPASPTPVPTSTPSPIPTRVAIGVAPSANIPRDLPYALPVPNKPGFVTSPYAPIAGYVDVRAFPSGTEVKDPFTGKLFLTP